MRNRRVRASLVVAAAASLLALGGCGSGSGDETDGVASATGEGSGEDGETGGSLSEEELHEKLLDYAQCLRDHGLDVEDPAPGEGIQVQIEGDPTTGDAAMKACEHLAPPPPSDADEEAEREEMLDYARCMRDNGVEKFADPKPGEGINIGTEVAEDPDFSTAEKACAEELGLGEMQKDRSGGDL